MTKPTRYPTKTPLAAAREAAEALAIQALAFLAAEPERLGHFLAASGIGPAAIRESARDPGFLAGVMDHIASDERLLLAFAAHADVPPLTVTRAVGVLGGTHQSG